MEADDLCADDENGGGLIKFFSRITNIREYIKVVSVLMTLINKFKNIYLTIFICASIQHTHLKNISSGIVSCLSAPCSLDLYVKLILLFAFYGTYSFSILSVTEGEEDEISRTYVKVGHEYKEKEEYDKALRCYDQAIVSFWTIINNRF